MSELGYLSEANSKDHIKELVWSFRMILPDVDANLVSQPIICNTHGNRHRPGHLSAWPSVTRRSLVENSY